MESPTGGPRGAGTRRSNDEAARRAIARPDPEPVQEPKELSRRPHQYRRHSEAPRRLDVCLRRVAQHGHVLGFDTEFLKCAPEGVGVRFKEAATVDSDNCVEKRWRQVESAERAADLRVEVVAHDPESVGSVKVFEAGRGA